MKRAVTANPSISIAVFINKVDGDLFLSEEQKSGARVRARAAPWRRGTLAHCLRAPGAADKQREIQQGVTNQLTDAGMDVTIDYFLTSIYDHSVFEAMSKVVQKLIRQMPTLENLLNNLITVGGGAAGAGARVRACGVVRPRGVDARARWPLLVAHQNSGIEKAFLFDVVSKIYVATDSNPVEPHAYELSADMIDVVIDVSCIYGCGAGARAPACI